MSQDQETAMVILGNIYKQHLKEEPLVTYFEPGITKGGYWNYSHMNVQFEGVVVVLKVLYP